MGYYLSIYSGCGLFAAYCVWSVFHGIAKQERELHALPRTEIRNVQTGARVRVIGTAVAIGVPAKAPYTGKTCVAYDAELSISGDDGSRGRKSSEIVPFRVHDDSGAIDVALDFVKLELKLCHLETQNPRFAHTFGDSVLRRELGAQGLGGGLAHWENILEPDQPGAVIGIVERGADGALRLVGTKRQPVVISNQYAAFKTASGDADGARARR